MRFQEMIETVDTHTGGEPTRIILSGIPKLEGNSVREKRTISRNTMTISAHG